jgi:hypothetical protein
MIPTPGCDPKINIVFIGGVILEKLRHGEFDTNHLMKVVSEELNLSLDHIILSMDWLYILSAIKFENDLVMTNEVNKP